MTASNTVPATASRDYTSNCFAFYASKTFSLLAKKIRPFEPSSPATLELALDMAGLSYKDQKLFRKALKTPFGKKLEASFEEGGAPPAKGRSPRKGAHAPGEITIRPLGFGREFRPFKVIEFRGKPLFVFAVGPSGLEYGVILAY